MEKRKYLIFKRIVALVLCFSIFFEIFSDVEAAYAEYPADTTFASFHLPEEYASGGLWQTRNLDTSGYTKVPTAAQMFPDRTLVGLKTGYHWVWYFGYLQINNGKTSWIPGTTATVEFGDSWAECKAYIQNIYNSITVPIYSFRFQLHQIPTTYTITYHPNGGTGNTQTQNVKYNSSYTTKPASTFARTGYTFAGWNTKANGTEAWHTAGQTKTYTWAYSFPLYAQWTPNVYTVTLDNQGADTMGTTAYYEKYDSGNYTSSDCSTTISSITKPEKKGYAFGGYYTEKNGGGDCYINEAGLITSTKTTFTANTTLYAKWILKEHTISYNANGGTGTMSPSVISEDGGVLTANSFTRKGYSFMGWATAVNGDVVYKDKATIYPTKDMTLYAVWQINSYKVTYNANGGTSDTSYVMHDYGSNVDLSAIAVKDGYTFIGWNTDASSRMPLTALVMGDKDVVLYAVYTIEVSDIENHTYPNYNGTTDIPNDEVYLLIQLPDGTTKEKAYPLTYQYDVNSMVYKYKLASTDISSFVENEAYYYYYVIVRDNAGNETVLLKGSVDEKGSVEPDAPEPVLPKEYRQTVKHYKYNPRTESTEKWNWFNTTTVSVKEGTLFEPSYITPPTGYKTDHIDSGDTVAGEKIYNAYYMPIEYTLTFDANGGTSSIASKKVLFDDYYGDLPTAVREGYTFDGWNTKEDGTGTTIKRGDIYTTTDNTTVHAQWIPNVYTVTLDSQGAETAGTTEYYEKYDSGNYTSSACTTTISSIIIPERTGYTFKGYWTEKDGGGDGYVTEAGVITSTKTTFTENTILYADWDVNEYSIKYDANGGSGSMSPTSVVYDKPVKLSANIFEKTGSTFIEWNTKKDGSGKRYADKETVEKLVSTNNGSITLYAQWSLNSYKVTYDYTTNGGISVSKSSEDVNYGDTIDLTITADKPDYIFVGWNTDPTATTGLTSLTMSTSNVKLYAIFKKTITVTFVENSNNGIVTTTLSDTVYNNKTVADFLVSEHTTWTGWTNNGWTDKTQADADAITSTGAAFTSGSNVTLYALYVSSVTLSYDANGSTMEYDSQTKECYYNAYGNSLYPAFVIANAPVLQKHTFVNWKAESGRVMDENGNQIFAVNPMEEVMVAENTVLKAVWDEHPVIEAYNRYFTLEQAQSGAITEAELLEKVTARDEEAKSASNPDGILENGVDVIVKNYKASDFTGITGNKSISITYEATDSFGNVVEKTVMIQVVDTTMKKSQKVRYIRFISARFYADEAGNLLPAEKGGLETTSIWRANESYKSVLESALFNTKVNEEYKTIEYFGSSSQVKIAGSGDWQTEKSTWVFTKQDIEGVKSYVDTHGYGNVKETNALDLFIEAFKDCLKIN